MWRVPSERITLDLDGPTVEVERVSSWALQLECLAMLQRFVAAAEPAAEYAALAAVYDRFAAEAQPTWDITDHRGPVPCTGRGMLRLPTQLGIQIVAGWAASLAVVEQPASAVDAVVPAGPLNREIKRRLRSVKAA